MAGSISVTEAAGAAFGFLGRSWLRAGGALALTGLLGGAAAIALVNREFARTWLLVLAYLLAAAMAQGGLFRIAYTERHPADLSHAIGFGGLQWGAVEWRLLGVTLLRTMLFSLLGALVLTLLLAVYIGLAAAEAGPGLPVADPAHWRHTLSWLSWTVMAGLGLAGAAGLCWIGLRLYLAYPATVARGRVQLLSTWPLTRGHVWSILGGVILVTLLPAAALATVARVGRGLLALSDWGDSRMAFGAVGLAACLSQALLLPPLGVGLMSYLYDRLGPEDAGES